MTKAGKTAMMLRQIELQSLWDAVKLMKKGTFQAKSVVETICEQMANKKCKLCSEFQPNLIEFFDDYTPVTYDVGQEWNNIKVVTAVGVMAAGFYSCQSKSTEEKSEILFEVLAQGKKDIKFKRNAYHQNEPASPSKTSDHQLNVFKSLIEFACVNWKNF